MIKRILLFCIIVFCLTSCVHKQNSVKRPKLVIGLVIDQMRWDYLYRYNNRYSNRGFKRLMRDGFNCQNTMINYLPANTGPGHTCIYTGSVPSIHGIAGNDWIDNLTGTPTYCVSDNNTHLNGDTTKGYSPRNLLVTTITDELKLATNLRSKVYGIAIKDRGGILPAGHLANGAYWYNDKNGSFTSSNYYPNPSPQWLQDFNKRKVADSLMKQNWTLLYSPNSYIQSTQDANNYEKGFKNEKAPVFPHVFDSLADSDKYTTLKTTPQGNSMTLSMAKACIEGEKMGQGDETDFLCVSISSTDYMGHQFGPNSMEAEDMYLRLDKEIGDFIDYLDSKIGKGNYLFFLTADHGAAHNATFLEDRDVPAGFAYVNTMSDLNTYLKGIYQKDSIVVSLQNYQVYFNNTLITTAKLDKDKIKNSIYEWFGKKPEVQYIVDFQHMDRTPLPEPLHTMMVNGYNRLRSGEMQIIMDAGWYDYGSKQTGTTHGTWQPYDTHIPLIWYGWNVGRGETSNTVYMTDISATLAAMLHIQMPNGCIGKVITEVTDSKLKR